MNLLDIQNIKEYVTASDLFAFKCV